MAGRYEGMGVFITGASSGIGAALAEAYAREGAGVALAARREGQLREVLQRIEASGGRGIALVCDVTDRGSLDAAVAKAVEAFGGIDIAVANAGFGINGTMKNISTEEFRRQFDTNFFGVLDTIYAVLPHLTESRGRLGIVSSVMGEIGAPASGAYCASKFALNGLSESIHYELSQEGVSVTCIMPGIVESNIRRIDNRGVLHADRPDPAPQWLCVPAPKAAQEIMRALHRRKPVAVITGHGKVAVWLHRHFPGLFRALMRRASRGRLAKIEARKRAKETAD